MRSDLQGYVSFETALSAHGVLDDHVHAIRIATAGSDRKLVVPGIGLCEWISMPDELLWGDASGSQLDFPGWRVASPEKALVDLLWLCESRGFAVPIDSLRLEDLDRGRLEQFAELMQVELDRLYR